MGVTGHRICMYHCHHRDLITEPAELSALSIILLR